MAKHNSGECQTTSSELYELAKEKFYKVYDFDESTKPSDRNWIRVGIIEDVHKPIKWNFFDGAKLISETNFDKADVFTDGRTEVVLDGKYNILKSDGSMVFNDWYDCVFDIPSGGYIVEEKLDKYGLDRRSAFSDYDGSVFSEWYSNIVPMLHKQMYCVSKKNGNGVLDRLQAVYDFSKREIVSDWYDDVCIFVGKVKYARIRKGQLYNLIGEDCKPVFEIWSKKPFTVSENGTTQVFSDDGKCYNADVKTGKLELVV